MKDLGKWSLDNSLLIRFAVFTLIIGGILSFWDMSKLEDPEIKVKQAVIVTTYPGASAKEVEREISEKIEMAVRGLSSIERVDSRSMNDLSIITVELSTLLPESEVEQNWDFLRRKVYDVQSSLPSGSNTSIVMDNFGDVYGMFYTLTYSDIPYQDAEEYADYLKKELHNIDGVSDILIYGKRDRRISVVFDREKLSRIGIHPADLLTDLNAHSKVLYSGYYESGNIRVRLDVGEKFDGVESISKMLIKAHDGNLFMLGDIAKVYQEFDQPYRELIRYNGSPALALLISAKAGTDITKLGSQVDNKIEELNSTLFPDGISFNKVFFQPAIVKSAIGSFILNLLASMFIVILVLYFTMGFRSAYIIGITLFITVLGSVFLLNQFDGTIQRVSLGSFILAMGMLVDNSIVIMDGIINDYYKKRKSKLDSLISIGKQTAMPLLGATLIAILAFLPIFLSPDTAGIYVRDLFIVLAISLVLSWLLALTFVPVEAQKLLKSQEVNNNSDNAKEGAAYRWLGSILKWSLSHKTVVVILSFILVIISIFSYRFIPKEFFPDMNYNQLYVEYKLPESRKAYSDLSNVYEIENYIRSLPYVKNVTTSFGSTAGRYNLVRSMADPSLSYAEFIVDFNNSDKLNKHYKELQYSLIDNFPEAFIRVKKYNLMFKKFPVELRFKGPDLSVLRDLSVKAREIMSSSGVAMLVTDDLESPVPVLKLNYNQEMAKKSEISRSDIALSMLFANGGIPFGQVYEGTSSVNLYMMGDSLNTQNLQDLVTTPIFPLIPNKDILGLIDNKFVSELMTGTLNMEERISDVLKTIPLDMLVYNISLDWEDPVINRNNGIRAITVQCEPKYGYTAEDVRLEIASKVDEIELPSGYSYSWEGEYKASNDSTKYLFKNFPLAIMLMLAILLALFKDFKKPLVIILCIPLLTIGIIPTILLSGKTFGFVAIVGSLGIIGMIIKNGVVLVDEINSRSNEGILDFNALIDSSKVRFMPVVMASATTILGMIPLVRDELFGSMAITIMGGLFVGTLVTLIFIPVLYAMFFRIKE